MKSTRIRPGLYRVVTDSGRTYSVEDREVSPEWGGGWLWYVQSDDEDMWLDPFGTRRAALSAILSIEAARSVDTTPWCSYCECHGHWTCDSK
jgi:hypothetical protein